MLRNLFVRTSLCTIMVVVAVASADDGQNTLVQVSASQADTAQIVQQDAAIVSSSRRATSPIGSNVAVPLDASVQVNGIQSPEAACSIVNDQGAPAGGFLAWTVPDGGMKIWVDPAGSGGAADPGCGQAPTYPFLVQSIDILLADASAFGQAGVGMGTLEYVVDIECPVTPGDPCSQPGLALTTTATQTLVANDSGTYAVNVPINQCVEGGFFVGIRYLTWTGSAAAVPSPLWDGVVRPLCHQWITTDGATWTDQENFFTPPGNDTGWAIVTVNGNADDTCTPTSCTASVCGNGVIDAGEDCDGIMDGACPGMCGMVGTPEECTCPISICQATCAGGTDEGEPCGMDVNGGCNAGTCVGDGSACSPLAQDCAVGMGPCNTAPGNFSSLGILGTGGTAGGCGNGFLDPMTRDTDWWTVDVTDDDGDGFAQLAYTLNSDFDASAFIIGNANGDCQMVDFSFGAGITSDDCMPASESVCVPAPATYTIFVGADLNSTDDFLCTDPLAPFEYTLDVQVDNCSIVCGDNMIVGAEECDGTAPNACVSGVCVPAGDPSGLECTCDESNQCSTCPGGATLEGETCGNSDNEGCSAGTCTGDGLDCSPVAQDCAMGQGPCVPTTGATGLGALGGGSSVDACGDTNADAGLRDTDWYSFTLTETAVVTVTLDSEVPMITGLFSGNVADCPNLGGIGSFLESDDCAVDTTLARCLDAGDYVIFAAPGTAAAGIFEGLGCTQADAPFNYTFNVSAVSTVAEGAGTCNDGIDNDCNGITDCFEFGCAGVDGCPASAIPTMSEWGLAVMLMLMLIAGTIVFARRRAIANA